MCNGFSGFLHKNGTVFFSEPNNQGNISHHDVLARMPKQFKNDDDLVAFEFPAWTIKSFQWDSVNVPAWANKQKCVATFKKVKPIWAEYNKVREQAYAEYKKVTAPAYAEYEKVKDAAYAEYEKVTAPAYAEYKKVKDAAYAEYEKVKDAAYAEYEKVRDAAYAEMIEKLSKIDGHLKEI
jgi:hypothetical protein